MTWDAAVHVMPNKKLQYQPEAHLGEKGWLPKDIDILYDLYLDLPRGAEWMIRGACTPSLSVQTAPFGRCWYIYNITLEVKDY